MRKPESEEAQGKVMETRVRGGRVLARPRMEHQEEVVTTTEGASGELRTEGFVSEAVKVSCSLW